MMNVYRVLILLMLCVACSPMALALDLKDAVARSLDHSSRLAAAEAQQASTSENVSIAKALLLPNIRFNGSHQYLRQRSYYKQNIAFISPTLRATQTRAGISLVQPIFHYDRFSRYQQGKVSSEMGDLELEAQRQLLRLEVIMSYLDAVQASSEVDRQKDVLESLQQLAAQTQAAFAVGTASANDALQVQSQLDLAQADMLALKHALRLHQTRLSTLSKSPVQRLQRFYPNWYAKVEGESWLARLLIGNLQMRLLKEQVDMSRLQIDVDMGSALPTLDLVAGYDWQRSTASQFGSGSISHQSYVGLRLDVPLYAGGGAWSKLRQTQKDKLNLEHQQDQLVQDLGLQGRELLQGIRNAQVQIKALGQAQRSATQAHRAAQVSFEVGLKDLLEVLDAQARLSEVQGKMNQAKVSELKLKAQLYYLAGALDASYVEKIASALEARP
ncbi:MAG: TolC family protein [Mariprofundaceae bacterium]|nr:TolC family protein [Mariprofundaceae bacterium]